MLILGILSLIQITSLPGLISLRLIRFRGSFWQGVIYTFALSLLINYCLIFFLIVLKLYVRPLILALFAIQATWVVWLYREDLRKPLIDVFQNLWDKSALAIIGLFSSSEDDLAQSPKTVRYLFMLFTLITLFFSLNRIWWLFGVFVDNIGSVFEGWDAVFSWNRWAEVWFNGKIPLDSRFYPQLVPANWSLTYMFIGESNVQMFAKSIMPIFAMGIFFQLLDLGITLRQPGFFVAIIILRALIVKFIGTGITNGYTDIAVAFFAILPFYTIFKAQAAKTESEQRILWILGFFFAATAAVTKQSGVYIFLLYPLLVYVVLLRPAYGNRLNPSIWRSVLTWGAFATLIPLVWYGFKLTLISQGIDLSEITGNADYAALAHGNVGLAFQIIHALQYFGAYLILFPLVLCALPWLPPSIRWLFAIFILPFPVVWAVMASYDTRNLAIVLPILALASGLSIEAIARVLLRLLALTKIEKWTISIVPVVSVVLLLFIALSYPDSRIRADDMEARQQLFSPSLNRELHRVFSDDPNALILTNYPVAYVVGRENSQVSFWYADPKEFEHLMQNDKITHLLVPSWGVNLNITSRIEQWESESYLIFVFQDKGSSVVPYKLYVIRR